MTENNDPAAARKRRKEIMQSLRAENKKEGEAEDALPPKKRKAIKKAAAEAKAAAVADEEEDEDEEPPVVDTEEDPDNMDKKMQIRYDPEVPMNKEQLAAWRREARRVRNRESAAASRQRIRDRITELEVERDEWKTRFSQATDRLTHLERLARGADANGDE
jgi:hypothetical protein